MYALRSNPISNKSLITSMMGAYNADGSRRAVILYFDIEFHKSCEYLTKHKETSRDSFNF